MQGLAETPVSAMHLKDRIAPLLPWIAAHARETEKAGRVSSEAVARLRDCGYFDAVKPVAYGGRPVRFAELVDANIDLASACASTGSWSFAGNFLFRGPL